MRQSAAAALLLLILLVHLWLAFQLNQSRLGEGAADRPPPPIAVAFVRQLAPAAAPERAPRPPPRRAARPARPASEPVEVEPPAEPPVAASAPTPTPTPIEVAATADPPNAPEPAGSQPAAPASVAPASAPASAPAELEWPPSTRLSYTLTGQYRGPLFGSAVVEWLRQGDRYQVRVSVKVPPVFERRMVSDGVLGLDGLSPQRYDQETTVLLQDLRRDTVTFDERVIRLANGNSVARLPGVQDTASQFVQLTWLFLSRPEALTVGERVQFPLALPRRLAVWTYEVTEAVPVWLPFGPIDTFHIQPRPETLRPNELSVELWIAPSLQYLPVRIVIRQDAESYVTLELADKPLQAAPSR